MIVRLLVGSLAALACLFARLLRLLPWFQPSFLVGCSNFCNDWSMLVCLLACLAIGCLNLVVTGPCLCACFLACLAIGCLNLAVTGPCLCAYLLGRLTACSFAWLTDWSVASLF